MTDKKTIAVLGATGQQGGGLVRAILADPSGPFAVRALTRNVRSAKAQALAAQGAEVAEADLDDEAGLRAAFEGAYGAFVMTNYFVERTPAEEVSRTRARMELDQAAAAARAAKAAGLQHVVWSSVDDTRPHFSSPGVEAVPLPAEGSAVPHFDAKAQADAFFAEQGVPTTILKTSAYFEALKDVFAPTRAEDGTLVLTLPIADRTMSVMAVEDIGRIAWGVFRLGDEYIGETVGVAGEHVTGEELAAKVSSTIGEKVVYRPVTWDEFRALPFPGAVEIGNMFQFFAQADATWRASHDVDRTRRLNPQLESLDDWLAAHGDEIPRG